MTRVVVVGGGASAAHCALAALEAGASVLMIDVGRTPPEPVRPDATFDALRELLDDPAAYFLGEDLRGVLWPDHDGEYYGLPPSKRYVFDPVAGFRVRTDGFEPLASFARGGLAEAWTAGCYSYSREELADFPVAYEELERAYARVAGLIGVTGLPDDLEPFMPAHEHLAAPLELDAHSRELFERYARRRARLNRQGCFVGRSRVAVLTEDRGARGGCVKLGRCLWGCPRGSLYTPAATLDDCRRHSGFEYRNGLFASQFRFDGDRRIRSVVAFPFGGGAAVEIPADELVLAAGTLGTARIILESWRAATGEVRELCGLMDNRQVLVPFVNWRRVGRAPELDAYQYHQLAIGFDGATPRDHVHGQITTLKSALVHPVIQGLPFDLRAGLRVFRRTHPALGLVNLNFSDWRRDGNVVTLDPETRTEDGGFALSLRYAPDAGDAGRVALAVKRARAALRALGCVVPRRMVHVRPMGASVHYAGTLPMCSRPEPWTTAPDGRSRDFPNLRVVDGSVFPSLPAKQLTFTMMANAARVGALLGGGSR